ncbi:MAG TPA: DUF3107 domain-containing protein [Nocardioides sp.]
MEVKIGIQQAQRELIIDVDQDIETVEKHVTEAVASDGVISLTDTKGRRVLVPTARLAYVEIGGGVTGAVGFRS